MSFQFQSCLYPSSSQMHAAIAHSYLSAGGLNNDRTMQEFLAKMSDQELALDAESEWELTNNPDYDRSELLTAFSDLRTEIAAT